MNLFLKLGNLLTTMCLLWSFTAGNASALENAANGKRLAIRWCAACHLVTPEQKSASTDVPPFETIAKRPVSELENLPAFLADPHPSMPDYALSRQEIADLVAYILSLKPKG